MGMELLALNSSPLCNVTTTTTTTRTRRRIHYKPYNFNFMAIITSASKVYDSVLENKKHVLLTSLQDTHRGLLTTPHQRSSIEQALVSSIFNFSLSFIFVSPTTYVFDTYSYLFR
ncbi:variant 2 [Lathyrus oleraceus]|uniref:Variant 2 n=1 Tax=Pisum sativum TaxID=3888 RepID=A0A9D4W0Y3_PEA|nr:variant 2 [Pisum sativum]